MKKGSITFSKINELTPDKVTCTVLQSDFGYKVLAQAILDRICDTAKEFEVACEESDTEEGKKYCKSVSQEMWGLADDISLWLIKMGIDV